METEESSPTCAQHYLRKRKRQPQSDEILKVSPGLSAERDLRPIKWGARRKICYKNPETSLQIVVREEREQMPPNADLPSPLKAPKDMQARWSNERYRTAQEFLIDILHAKKAVPGSPIARQELRIEARKYIGDTGLLDHLLKRMTDRVVASGERFRRRHNWEGGMEYWLEDASLMELRKSANIRDPRWVPPSGWKPGDPLVPLCESEEVKHLKEEVDYLRSELQMLSKHEVALPCEADIITQPSPSSLTVKSFKETVENQLESLNWKVEELQTAYSQLDANTYLFQKTPLMNTNSGVQVESADREGFDGDVLMERLEKLELEVHTMVQENKARQEMLGVEKLTLETQFVNLWKAVMTMQEKLSSLEQPSEQQSQARSGFAPCAPRALSNEVTGTVHHAFKPCKPPGNFSTPTVLPGREKSSTFQLEDALSPRKSSSQVTAQMGRGTQVGDAQQLFFTAAMQAFQDGFRDNHEARTSWLGLARPANELQIQGLAS